jgi:adenylate cyclase
MAAATASILATIVRMSGPFRQRRLAHEIFGGRLAQQGHDHLAENIGNGFSEPMVRNATLVFCEIVNGPELIDELPLAECARLTREFVERGRKHFLQAGGYLQGADGEGICALFGFPNENRLHAVEAARAALSFRDQFRVLAREQPESLGKIDLRIGINSGTVVATLRDDRPGSELVIAGEPFEVARRLARANEIYGSEVLLGPQTYHAAGDEILARPMDFLRDGEDHERLEVYELLALSEQATPEAVARRDRFWTGVVYFRERRWNEAFAEFDRARNGDEETDRPLQWYLRQLEPHRLKMTTNPAEAVNPVLPLS